MPTGESSYRRYLNGDQSGFDEIVDLYHDNLIFFIMRYVSNEYDAEDIAAETFLEMLIHPTRYSFKSSLKTYVFSVARNKAVDFVRKHKLQAFTDINEDPSTPFDLTADEAVRGELNDSVAAALSKIKREYAEVLYFVYFEGLDSDEIMRIMKKSKRQVSNLLYRAKAAMKNELTKGGFDDEE